MTLKSNGKFEEKLDCGLEKDMRNLAIFYRALESLKIETLMGSKVESIYLFKVEKISSYKFVSKLTL